MGYTIDIGEAILEGSKEDLYLKVGVIPQSHDDAPVFANDFMTGNGNSRSPSYTVWAELCRNTGLYGMFFGINGERNPYMEPDPESHRETPIMADHPGFQVINKEDVSAIKKALDWHIIKYGELEAGFRDWHEKDEQAPLNANECAERARLIWMHYWCDWAVNNCKFPIIANT